MKRALCTLFIVSELFSVQSIPPRIDDAFKVVNKKVSIGQYTPHDLVTFNEVKVSQQIVQDLKRLLEAAKKDGFTLKVCSGYRSFNHQVGTFNRRTERVLKKHPNLSRAEAEEIANTDTARPGHSEHQLGTTVDILSSENGFAFSSNASLKYVGWLEKNAQRFNFRISYPKGSAEYIYEPWHLRWYPKTTSQHKTL